MCEIVSYHCVVAALCRARRLQGVLQCFLFGTGVAEVLSELCARSRGVRVCECANMCDIVWYRCVE